MCIAGVNSTKNWSFSESLNLCSSGNQIRSNISIAHFQIHFLITLGLSPRTFKNTIWPFTRFFFKRKNDIIYFHNWNLKCFPFFTLFSHEYSMSILGKYFTMNYVNMSTFEKIFKPQNVPLDTQNAVLATLLKFLLEVRKFLLKIEKNYKFKFSKFFPSQNIPLYT